MGEVHAPLNAPTLGAIWPTRPIQPHGYRCPVNLGLVEKHQTPPLTDHAPAPQEILERLGQQSKSSKDLMFKTNDLTEELLRERLNLPSDDLGIQKKILEDVYPDYKDTKIKFIPKELITIQKAY